MPTDADAARDRLERIISDCAPFDPYTTPRERAALDAYRDAILASRDPAWREVIEGMRAQRPLFKRIEDTLHGGYVDVCSACECDQHDCLCDVRARGWNAALSALADRMGAENG